MLSYSSVNLEGSFVILIMHQHIQITRLKLICREIRDLGNYFCYVLEFKTWNMISSMRIIAIVAAAARFLQFLFPANLY